MRTFEIDSMKRQLTFIVPSAPTPIVGIRIIL
jgi:hypothetical protein